MRKAKSQGGDRFLIDVAISDGTYGECIIKDVNFFKPYNNFYIHCRLGRSHFHTASASMTRGRQQLERTENKRVKPQSRDREVSLAFPRNLPKQTPNRLSME